MQRPLLEQIRLLIQNSLKIRSRKILHKSVLTYYYEKTFTSQYPVYFSPTSQWAKCTCTAHTNVMGHNSNHLPRNMFKWTHYPPLPPTFGISLPPTFKNSLSQLMQPEIRPSQISVWRNDLLHHQGSLVTSRSNSLWKHFSCFSVFEWNTVLSLAPLIRFGLFLS